MLIIIAQVVKYGKGQVKRRVLKMVGTGKKAKIIWISATKGKSPMREGLSSVRHLTEFSV
jgi:hypothetical protein